MTGKLLQALGVLAVLALVAGSFAALVLVKQRIHVTVAEDDEASRGPDPLALLRADVEEMKRDLGALSQGLGQGLEALHGALDEADAERERAIRAEIAALGERLASLESRLASAQASGAAPAVAAQPGTDAPKAAVPSTESPSSPSTSAPRKSFLAFQLPSDSFAFDKTMRLEIVPSLSRVGFDAKSTLHDFSGTTSKVAGELTTCLARPEQSCRGSIRVEATALETGEPERDAEMRKSLDTTNAPTLTFEWQGFALDALDAGAQRLSGRARGELTIHGTTRALEMPVRVSVDASKRVVIEGEAKLSLHDYAVETPTKLGLIKVEDEVKIWIALRARSLGAQEGGAVESGAHDKATEGGR